MPPLCAQVNKKNIQAIVAKLCEEVTRHEGEYKHELITKIVEMCRSAPEPPPPTAAILKITNQLPFKNPFSEAMLLLYTLFS